MKFAKLEFKKGLNLTIRRGTRHSAFLIPGMQFEICDLDGVAHFIAYVDKIVVKGFKHISEAELKYQHDPDCRTFRKAIDVMRKHYGDDFDTREIVTLVWFRVCTFNNLIDRLLVKESEDVQA